jgi:hypothetical protein
MQIRKISIFFTAILFPWLIRAQPNFDVENIPPKLKENARSVIRINNRTLELKSEGKAKFHVQYAITVLNENGNEDAVFREFYDKFRKISIERAVIYNAVGKKTKLIPQKDIKDFSAISGFSTYEDDRVKVIDPEIRVYPYTVEYEYTCTFNGTLHLPSWYSYAGYDISVQHSEMTVVVPEDMSFRYFEKNITNPMVKTIGKSETSYFWEINDLKAINHEPFSGSIYDYTPTVHFAMNEFVIAGHPGDLSSWREFGKWVHSLNVDRKTLPQETVNKLLGLVDGLDTDYKKVRRLYQYMQNKTRYVSVQVGIGGWQAFEAETVDRLGYGDCKALANYMQAILSAVGIKSYYTLVNAGSERKEVLEDFPSNQFNHVFLCVPVESDTLWLECTSQTDPCGFLGTGTDDRYAVVVREDGGHLVKTPEYTVADNLITNLAEVKLTEEGKGNVAFERIYKGIFYEYADYILRSSDNKKKDLMYESIDIPSFTLIDFTHEANPETIPWIVEKVNLELGNYATKMGSNIFLTLNLMNQVKFVPKKLKERLSDINIIRSYVEHDTIIYHLPEGYAASSIPEPVNIESKFGKYSYRVISNDDQLTYIRKFERIKGSYPKEDYPLLVDFYDKIVTADQKKIALKKQ